MLKVCCAIIQHDNKVLVAQRSESMLLPLKWEFPGGKVEKGESAEDCIIREIKEELRLEISIVKQLTPVIHHYDSFSLELFPFVCISNTGEFEKAEHKSIVWSTKEDLLSYDWAAADIPIVYEYINLF